MDNRPLTASSLLTMRRICSGGPMQIVESEGVLEWRELSGFIEHYRNTVSATILYPATSNIDFSWMTDSWLVEDISRQTGFRVDDIKRDLDEWRKSQD